MQFLTRKYSIINFADILGWKQENISAEIIISDNKSKFDIKRKYLLWIAWKPRINKFILILSEGKESNFLAICFTISLMCIFYGVVIENKDGNEFY